MSDELRELKSREETFVSHVAGKPPLGPDPKNFKKSRAPLFVLFGLVIIIAGLLYISQMIMPFAIINRFREEFNTIGISSTLRADNILDYQLSAPGSFLALSELQRSSLKDFNIIPVDVKSGDSFFTALVFKNKKVYSSVVPAVVLDSLGEEKINAMLNALLASSDIKVSGAPISAYDALQLPAFSDSYSSASKAWRGGSSGWYDSLTDLTEARLAISRSRYANWAATVFNSGTKEAWKSLARLKTSTSDSGVLSYGTLVDKDEAGNDVYNTGSGSVDSSSLTAQTTVEGVRNVLNSKIMSVAKLAATTGCVGVEIASTIQTVVSAQQSLQYLNLMTGYAEAVQGVQNGSLDSEIMQAYNERLTTKDPETGRSATASSGFTSFFSGEKIDPQDSEVKAVNIEGLMSSLGTLTGDVAFTSEAFQACSYIRMGLAATNFATTVLNFVPVLGQTASAIHIVAKVARRLALGVSVGAIASFVIPKILTQVVDNITKDVATEWLGGSLSHAMGSGANKFIGGNAQTGGGSAASPETFAEYTREKTAVLAREAEVERRSLSPLDVSSKNTFLGSLAYSLIPFATTSSVGGIAKNLGVLVSNSVTNILPSASAIAETNIINSIGDCPVLSSVGIVGDAYCNPYFITDRSTISLSPISVEEKVASLGNNFSGAQENGQKIINPNSNLGKYIKFCGQRVSSFGVADANIANEIVATPSSLVSSLPLVSDVAEIIHSLGEAENIPWISGSACVASSENPLWEENKFYQRYVEDQRLFESAGLVSESSVTAMLDGYYQENPLDNSLEGVLARYSGLEKETVVAVLDTLDALDYLASYDASSRFKPNEDKDSSKTINLATNHSSFDSAYANIIIYGQCGDSSRCRGFLGRRQAELVA